MFCLQIISCQSGSSRGVTELAGYVPSVWELLLRHAECPEEGTRNVVSECLGKLTLLEPHQLLSRLRHGLTSPSPLMRATVLTALKFTISDQVCLYRFSDSLYILLYVIFCEYTRLIDKIRYLNNYNFQLNIIQFVKFKFTLKLKKIYIYFNNLL